MMLQARPLLFDLLSTRTAWLSERQAVLGQNVANADTPDFRPRDLKPMRFADLLGHGAAAAGTLRPVRTAAAHLAPVASPPGGFRDERAPSYEVTPSGNGVELAEQLQKMATTEQDHQLATSLYRRYVGMLRTALGVAQG